MNDSSYKVGYGKPPKHSRFRKGISGNRKGRPKGKRNIATILRAILEEQITVREGRVWKTFTKLEAALKQLTDKAASGDLIALRQLTALVRSAEEHDIEPATKQLTDVDLKIMQRVLQRQSTFVKGETDDDH
jgi:hypothetical protein